MRGPRGGFGKIGKKAFGGKKKILGKKRFKKMINQATIPEDFQRNPKDPSIVGYSLRKA